MENRLDVLREKNITYLFNQCVLRNQTFQIEPVRFYGLAAKIGRYEPLTDIWVSIFRFECVRQCANIFNRVNNAGKMSIYIHISRKKIDLYFVFCIFVRIYVFLIYSCKYVVQL